MSEIVGTLEIQMIAKMARLQQDMDAAKRTVAGAMSSIESAVGSAKAALGALGIGLGVGFFATLVKGSIDAADHLNDLSKSTSIAVEQLSGLKLAAKQSGGDLDSIAQSLNKLSLNMGKDAEKFAALGVSAKDPLEAFKQLSDVFVNIQDPQQRAAVMAQALGKSWAGAAPLLAEGGAKIQEMVDKGAKLSGVTKQMAVEADAFNDKWAQLTATGGGLNRQVSALLPIINALADDLIKVQESSKPGSFNPLAETFRALVIYWGNVAFVFKGVAAEAVGMTTQLVALAHFDFAAFKGIGDAMKKDAVEARAAFDAWEKKMMTAGTVAVETKKAVVGLSEAEKKAQAEAAARAADFLDKTKAQKDAYLAVQKHAEDYLKNLQKTTAEIGLSVGQKQTLEAATLSLTLHAGKERDAFLANAAAMIKNGEAAQLAVDTRKAMDDAQKKVIDGLDGETASILKNIEAAQHDISVIGKTKEQIALIESVRYDHITAVEKERLAVLDAAGACSAETEALRENIKAREAYKAVEINKAGAEARQAAIEAEKKANLDMWKSIDQTAHDTWVTVWQGGANAFERIGKTIKASILDLLYQMTIQKWFIQIAASVTGMAASGAASAFGGSAASSAAGSLFGGTGGLLQAGQTLWSGFSGSMAQSGAALANAMGFTNFGAGMAGQAISGTFANAAAMDAATSTAAMGAQFAAVLPYAAVAAVAIPIIAGLFGGGGDPAYNTGNSRRTFGATGAVLTTATDNAGGNNATADAFVMGMQSSYMKAAMQLGIAASATNFALGGNADSKSANFVLSGGAGTSASYQSAFQAKTDAAMQLEASRAVFAALQGSQLPGFLAKLFDGLTVGAMSQQQIADTLAFAGSVKQMRDALLETRAPLEILRANVQAGTEAFKTSAATFKNDFVAAIDRGINPAAFDQWKQLGTAIDQLAAADAQAAAANLQAATALAKQRGGMEIQIMQLSGDAAGALAAQRRIELAALDASLVPLQKRIYALQDASAAEQAAAAVTATRTQWQNQLDVLTGAKTQQQIDRATQLSGVTDAATLAIMRQVFATQDQQAAQQAAAQAQQQAAQAALQLKNSWQSVTDQIFNEVARIRGLMGTPQQSIAAAQAQFAISSAQARSGDMDAAKLLPGLSQSILSMAQTTAIDQVDLMRLQGQIANSLTRTAEMPVVQYGLTVPSAAAPANTIAVDKTLLAELLAEVKLLRTSSDKTAANTQSTASTLDNATGGGGPMLVTIA